LGGLEVRGIVGFVAVLVLVASVQPALAVCVNRGGALTCERDPNAPKYPNATQRFLKNPPAATPATNGQTIVLQPAGSDDNNAWVLTPQPSTAGDAAVLACGSSAGC